MQRALDEVRVVTRRHSLQKVSSEDFTTVRHPLIAQKLTRDLSCSRQIEYRTLYRGVGAENVGQDVTSAATNVYQLSEAAKRETGSDIGTLGAIDALHKARHRLASFRIRSDVLEECLSVDSREYRIASLKHVLQIVPCAQHGIVV